MTVCSLAAPELRMNRQRGLGLYRGLPMLSERVRRLGVRTVHVDNRRTVLRVA